MKKELTTWSDRVIETANRPKYTEANLKQKGYLIALTGGQGSGKDTAAEIFVARGFKRIAFADAMREDLLKLNPIVVDNSYLSNRLQDVVNAVGWDKAKWTYPEVRRLMRQYGESVKPHFGRDCWTNVVRDTILKEPHINWIISDMRFVEERDMVHKLGGISVRINRKGFAPSGEHISEQHLSNIMYDCDNDSDTQHLTWWIDNFLNTIARKEKSNVQ